ncbi:MAG TPA: amidohydrolase family protein [Burkholderiales bacterium]
MMYTCGQGCTNPNHRHGESEHPGAAAGKKAAKPAARPAAKAAAKTAMVKAKLVAGAKGVKKGKVPRVDLHCHYLNTDVAGEVAHLNPAQHDNHTLFANPLTIEVNKKQMADRAKMLSSIETRLKDMDKMGVDIQAICPAPFQYYYWAEASHGLELARKVNDRLAEIVGKWPERFVGMGSVPLQNADMACEELERTVKKLGFRGVEINTNVNGLNLTDKSLNLDKFFRKVQELDVVLFLHPTGFTHADRLKDHYFNNVIGNPLDTSIAVMDMIFDGVMQRYSKLKVVLPHAGGYVAHYPARMDHAWRARKDARVNIKKAPSSYLKKMYFDTIAFDPQMMRFLVDWYGAGQVVLGTDYPYDMGDFDPVGTIKSIPKLSRADQDMIAGGTAAKLLKIKY